MDIKELTPRFAVSGQICASDMATAAAKGIKTIINNRPDGEAPGQPSSDELAAQAAALKIAYVHIPVAGSVTDENIAAFKRTCRDLSGPMLAFCRSGMRSASLWALSQSTTLHHDEVLATTKQAGYDLEAMRPYLAGRAVETSPPVTNNTRFGFGKTVKLDFGEAIEKVTRELQKEGFGVLSDIDVAATLKSKIGVDMPAYRILGACNPSLAHQAVLAEPEIGLLLPCNVLLRAERDGHVSVSFMDPGAVLGLVGNANIEPLANQVKEKLARVLAAI